MNKDLLNILSNSNKDIDNQKLMDYLSGKLPPDQRNEVEQWMAESDFSDDALEGLQQIKQTKDIQNYVEDLHNNLARQLQLKKKRQDKRKFKDKPWLYLAIALIMAIAILAYIVIKKLG